MIRDLGVVLAAVTVLAVMGALVEWLARGGWVAVAAATVVAAAVCVERWRRLRADEREKWNAAVERWTTEETDQ